MRDVIALVPGYNEETRIADVIREASAHLPVLVVDDGSRDRTAEVAEEAGAAVIRQRPNQGKGAALRAGFRQALEEGAAAVLTLDADGQHDPAEIPSFLSRFAETGAELIIGARDFRQMPFVRRMSNRFARATFSQVVGRPILDNQSGYRLIAAPLLRLLQDSREQGFEFEVEMIVVCVREQMRLEWVPIRTIYGDEGSHISPFAHTANFLRILRKARRMLDAGGPLPGPADRG
jgi:glycosyltransferase involved in cell wall biosynthesis